jgi:hypothetical protein
VYVTTVLPTLKSVPLASLLPDPVVAFANVYVSEVTPQLSDVLGDNPLTARKQFPALVFIVTGEGQLTDGATLSREIVTSSDDEAQGPFDTVQRRTTEFDDIVTDELGFDELAIEAVPETTDQEPVPTEGLFADNVVVEPQIT